MNEELTEAQSTSKRTNDNNLEDNSVRPKRTAKALNAEIITNKLKIQSSALQKKIKASANCLRKASPEHESCNAETVNNFLQMDFLKNGDQVHELFSQSEKDKPIVREFQSENVQQDENPSAKLQTDFYNSTSESRSNFSRERNTSDFGFNFNNVLMFPQSNLHVNEVFEMLLGYFIEFNVVERARTKLIELIKILAGPLFENFNASNYLMNKTLNPPEEYITFNYYCQKCEKEVVNSSVKSEIKQQKKVCSNCETTNEVSLNNPNYFLTINFEYQLKLLMENETIRNCILKKITSRVEQEKERTRNICDIDDSTLHKETQRRFPNTITYNLSTDGAPVDNGKAATRSFWPLSVVLNDLPPDIRYKHLILVGIMVVTKEPGPHLMNLFIEKFREQALPLHMHGMKFNFPHDCIERTIRFTLLCVIADSPARAVLRNCVQHNGYDSCPFCYIHGLYAGIVKFPFLQCECDERTNELHIEDVRIAELFQKIHKGVKGRSSFCDFPNCDMIRSFSIDAMHNGILGITEQVWELIRPKLPPSVRAAVDFLLIQIKPPHEVHRVPCKISKKSMWKATHWKAYLLYYSVPILQQLELPKDFPTEFLEHYARFVNSMFTLYKTNISMQEFKECDDDLSEFVAYIDVSSGISAMTFNIHLLLHAVMKVIDNGPFWTNSAFPFEGFIFILKQYVNGPKGVDQQIVNKSLQRLLYQFKRPRDDMPSVVRNFCDSCISEKRFTASAKTIGNIHFFNAYLSDDCPENCETFLRCVANGTIFTSVKYTQNKSYNDSVIQLKNGIIAQIVDIFLKNEGCFFAINEILVEPFFVGNVQMKHIFQVAASPLKSQIIPFDEIDSKVVALDFKNKQFICVMPNRWEVQ